MRAVPVPTIEDALEYGYGALSDADDLYLSPQWLKVEETVKLAPFSCHMLCLRSDGLPSPAVAATWGFSVDEAAWWPFVRVDMVLSRLLEERQIPQTPGIKKALRSLLPNVFIGAGRGGTTSLRVHPGLSDAMARNAIAEMITGIEVMARARGISSVAFLYVSPEDVPLRDVLREFGYAEFGPTHNVATLHLEGQSFDDYLSGFGKRRRDSIRWERRKIAAAGVQIGLEQLSRDLAREMMPLEAQLFERYGHQEYPAEIMRRQHESVAQEFGGTAQVITARSAGTLRGYAAFIRLNNVLYSRDTGYDYMWKKGLPLYFEILFYSAIELAMRSGIRVIDYSYGSDETKASRGCDLHPRLGYVKALDATSSDDLESLCADLSYAEAPLHADGINQRKDDS